MNKYPKESREAQRQRRREKMCEYKAAFRTPEAAYQQGQRTYQCPHCGFWHRSGAFAQLLARVKRHAA